MTKHSDELNPKSPTPPEPTGRYVVTIGTTVFVKVRRGWRDHVLQRTIAAESYQSIDHQGCYVFHVEGYVVKVPANRVKVSEG